MKTENEKQIIEFVKAITKQHLTITKETKTHIYFRVGLAGQILSLYKKSINQIDTLSGLFYEAQRKNKFFNNESASVNITFFGGEPTLNPKMIIPKIPRPIIF